MIKEDIIDYVMNSPENTNRAVLSSMLDSVGGGGSSVLVYEVTYADNKYHIGGGVTFGDIRRAFESGQTIIFKYDYYYSDEDAWMYKRGIVTSVNYNITTGFSAGWEIHTDSSALITLSGSLDEAPYTLEALDAMPL